MLCEIFNVRQDYIIRNIYALPLNLLIETTVCAEASEKGSKTFLCLWAMTYILNYSYSIRDAFRMSMHMYNTIMSSGQFGPYY